MKIIPIILCCLITGSQFLYADQRIHVPFVVDKLIANRGGSVNGKFKVTGDATFDGDVVMGDNVYIGAKVLGEIAPSLDAKTLLSIGLPYNKKCMGIAKIIFCAVTAHGRFQSFKAKYVFGADLKDGAADVFIKRIKYSMYNHLGFMYEPENKGDTIYARALDNEYNEQDFLNDEEYVDNNWLLRGDPAGVAIRFQPPTKLGAGLSDAVVFYEIQFFGDLKESISDGGDVSYEIDLDGINIS